MRQFVVGEAHIGVLGIAAQVGQAHGVQNCGLWRAGCIRVVSVIAFAGNVTPPVGIEILVRDVVDERTLGQRKAGIVLREGFTEQTDCLEQLLGRQVLVAKHQHRAVDKRTIELDLHNLVYRLGEIDAADLRSSMLRKWSNRVVHQPVSIGRLGSVAHSLSEAS